MVIALPHLLNPDQDGSNMSEDNFQAEHHQMDAFSVLLALCEGKPPVDSPHKAITQALMFPLMLV